MTVFLGLYFFCVLFNYGMLTSIYFVEYPNQKMTFKEHVSAWWGALLGPAITGACVVFIIDEFRKILERNTE